MSRQPCSCRCGRGSTKLVGGRICPSDFNRAREVIKGKNGKGGVPIWALPVREMAINYSVDGGAPKTWRVSHSADFAELALDILRRERGSIVFLPAPGEDLPAPRGGHSRVCCCDIPQRAPVRFKCVKLDRPINGHAYGVAGEDDLTWTPPKGPKPPRNRPRATPKPAPKVPAWDAAWQVAKDSIVEIDRGDMTMSQLARELEARGIPTVRGGPWTHGKIERVLKGAPRGRPRAVKPAVTPMVIRHESKLEPISVLAARAEASMYPTLLDALRAARSA